MAEGFDVELYNRLTDIMFDGTLGRNARERILEEVVQVRIREATAVDGEIIKHLNEQINELVKTVGALQKENASRVMRQSDEALRKTNQDLLKRLQIVTMEWADLTMERDALRRENQELHRALNQPAK